MQKTFPPFFLLAFFSYKHLFELSGLPLPSFVFVSLTFLFSNPNLVLFLNSFDFPRSYTTSYDSILIFYQLLDVSYTIYLCYTPFFIPLFSGLFFYPVSFHLSLLLLVLYAVAIIFHYLVFIADEKNQYHSFAYI